MKLAVICDAHKGAKHELKGDLVNTVLHYRGMGYTVIVNGDAGARGGCIAQDLPKVEGMITVLLSLCEHEDHKGKLYYPRGNHELDDYFTAAMINMIGIPLPSQATPGEIKWLRIEHGHRAFKSNYNMQRKPGEIGWFKYHVLVPAYDFLRKPFMHVLPGYFKEYVKKMTSDFAIFGHRHPMWTIKKRISDTQAFICKRGVSLFTYDEMTGELEFIETKGLLE